MDNVDAPERTQASAVEPPEADATHAVMLVAPPSRVELVQEAVDAWRAALVEEAGGSARSDIDLLDDAALDLSFAHPSGMAQLFAGRPTRLSNLVRDGAALTGARRKARAVALRAEANIQRHGVAPTSLAIGMATWTVNPVVEPADDMAALAAATAPFGTSTAIAAAPRGPARVMRVPVLLRPVTVRARGSGDTDYELTLEPTVEVNPVLARALRVRGALLDPAALAVSTFTDGGFDPRPALARLAALGEAVLADFTLVDHNIVGSFVHPGQALVDDLDAIEAMLDRNDLIAALAGDEDATDTLMTVRLPNPAGDRDLGSERGVGDLDDAQRHIVDVVASGADVFVDAPAGSDAMGTVAAIVADAAAAGRTVLYVPGSRRGAVTLRERLDQLGLDDLVLDVPTDAAWRAAVTRRLLGAMTLAEPDVDEDQLVDLQLRTARLRDRLGGYVAALHARREPWGVSAFDALQHLAALTSARPTPRTTARIPTDAAKTIDAERLAALGSDLGRVAELGAFVIRPGDTSWYGAELHTEAEAEVALRRVVRLLDGALDHLVARSGEVAVETGLSPAVTLEALGEQLALLDDVRASLDVFLPEIFERSAADLVLATAPGARRTSTGEEMGFWVRRRLRKQAKDLVRPGRSVVDLHEALSLAERRRTAWRARCPAGGWPQLPDDLELVEQEYAAVRRDVEALNEVLPGGPSLMAIPLDELADRLLRLQADAGSLTGLPERASLLARLEAAGLAPVLAELRQRQVGAEVAPRELELAWWSTVFEDILSANLELAEYDGAALDQLSEQYTAADTELVGARSAPLLRHVVSELQKRLRRHRDEGEALFLDLVEESLGSLRETAERFPHVARHLRPVLVASPMLVPMVLPPTRDVDLVVLDAVEHLATETAVPALARGRQVVVVGDPRRATKSAVGDLAQVLPSVPLRADGTRRDPHLTAFLAEHGYDGVLTPVPLPESASLVHFHRVDGTGMPDASGVVDSTREEVAAVVDLVLTHALICPTESLAVVTGTPRHADAVREAVVAEVRNNPLLESFFEDGRPEPFVVADLAGVAGLSRDAIILSIGLGRTPHRRVLHQFGPISQPQGKGLLLDALGSTRHRLDVVSCFAAHDLDQHRLRGPGPRMLSDLLEFAYRRDLGQVKGGPQSVGDAQGAALTGAGPLLLDLAERLWRHGLEVELDHGLPGGLKIPLVVGHPSLPDRFLVAVLTDDEAYVAQPSVRTRDRLVADRLRAAGWAVVRVWSVAAFLDPQAEVDRVRRVVHALLPTDLSMPQVRTTPVPEVVLSNGTVQARPMEVGGWALTETGLVPLGEGASRAPIVWNLDDPLLSVRDTSDEPDAEAQAALEADGGLRRRWAADDVPGEDVALDDVVLDDGVLDDGLGASSRETGDVETGDLADGRVDVETGDDMTADRVEADGTREPDLVGDPVQGSVPSDGQVQENGVDEGSADALGPDRDGVDAKETAEDLAAMRPDVPRGLKISAYSADQLDALVEWLVRDGETRTTAELERDLRVELGVTRRGRRVDAVIHAAVTRASSGVHPRE